MKSILLFLKTFKERLFSADWSSAWTELGIACGVLGTIVTAFKSKEYLTALNDSKDFFEAMTGVLTALRLMKSSNKKAVQDPLLPEIKGDGTLPVVVVEPQSDVKLPDNVAAPKD